MGGNYITSALTQERDEAAARLAEAKRFRQELEAELKTVAQEAVISSGIDGVPWGADQQSAMPAAGDPAAEDQERKDAETIREEMRKQVAVKTEEMSLELAGFVQQGELTVQQAQEIWQAFKNLQQEFLNGTITAQEYSYSENALNEAMRQTIQTNAQHAETITREKQARQEAIAATISDWQATATAIVKSMGPLGQFRENMNQYGQQLLDLQMKLQNGTLSLDEYKKQVQQVTNAANAAAEAEKKKRLAAGDFAGAGLNFNQAIQDRVAQFQTQRFNQMVDQAVASLYGIGPAAQNVASGFNSLQNQMGQFGQSLNSFAGQGGSGQQMAQQLMTTFATVDGQIQLLQNNIALMQQNINMLDTYRQRAAVQEEIDAMQSQLMDLIYQANAGPVLTQTPLDPYADPGLNRNATVVNNNLELPNLTRMTNADAELMAALLVDTMQRRGVLSAT